MRQCPVWMMKPVVVVLSMFIIYCNADVRTGSSPQKAAFTQQKDPLIELITGMLSGVITALFFYPLECVEARMQISSKKRFVNHGDN
jgi:hypothetical protein